MKHKLRARIIQLYQKGGVITTDSGQSIEISTIPELPGLVMGRAEGLDVMWRAASQEAAIKIFAELAPGILGTLETALPDAAHAAQSSLTATNRTP